MSYRKGNNNNFFFDFGGIQELYRRRILLWFYPQLSFVVMTLFF